MPITNYLPSSRLIQPGVCTSTTRPASPFEGQAIFETDTDMVAIWNGTAWRYISATTPTNGTVLQIVNATTSTSTSSSSATYVDTTLTVSITPKSSTSKIFVLVNQSIYHDTAGGNTSVRLVRNSTTLQDQFDPTYNAGSAGIGNVSFLYLDSPSTTSATTYKTTFARRTGTGTCTVQVNSNPANITVMEIAG